MTRKELLAKLAEMGVGKKREVCLYSQDKGDPETDHVAADNLLLKFINDKEVTKAFKAITKWYS